MKAIIENAKKEMGLYDSDTGKSVEAYKIIDASQFADDGETMVIKYGDVTRGRIAQICEWYKPKEDFGMVVHYFISEMTKVQLSYELQRRFKDPAALSMFIFDNQ